MKLLIFVFVLIFTNDKVSAFDSMLGKYEVHSIPCSILFTANDGAQISQGFDLGQKISFTKNSGGITSNIYNNYFVVGKKEKSFTYEASFDRGFNKNTSLQVIYKKNNVTSIQKTNRFKFYVSKEFCHPYDFSGLSCVVGLINPLNWIPEKKFFEKREVVTTINFDSREKITIERVIDYNGLKKTTHSCQLLRVN